MMKFIFIPILFLHGIQVFAHDGGGHEESPAKKVEYGHHDSLDMGHISRSVNMNINKAYLKNVKPIFKNSCFDCHGSIISYPWYYKIPGIKQMIESDIKEAKKHFDFSYDYPFKSHDSQLNDLKALAKVIEEGTMPPFGYSLMHNGSKLTDQDKTITQSWIKESIKKLNHE